MNKSQFKNPQNSTCQVISVGRALDYLTSDCKFNFHGDFFAGTFLTTLGVNIVQNCQLCLVC